MLHLATLTIHVYTMTVSNNSSLSLETWWDSSWLCAQPEWKSHVLSRQNHLRPPCLCVHRSIRPDHLHMNIPPPQSHNLCRFKSAVAFSYQAKWFRVAEMANAAEVIMSLWTELYWPLLYRPLSWGHSCSFSCVFVVNLWCTARKKVKSCFITKWIMDNTLNGLDAGWLLSLYISL